ncbi:uncharacterized protein [Eurosta solidaginis]|uniref:uncharacterized protein n=1 Tax=Eurosta solidaginis TaxID=178769 RepID=UPI003530FF30
MVDVLLSAKYNHTNVYTFVYLDLCQAAGEKMERYLKRLPNSVLQRAASSNGEPANETAESCPLTPNPNEITVTKVTDEEPRNKKKMLYKQKIRQSWLSDKRFNQWLILRDNSLSCKYCLCKLQPKLSGLISHANRNKYIDALAPFKTGCQPMVPFKPARIIVDTKRADLRNAIHIAIHTSIRSVDHLTMMQKSTFLDSAIASNLQLGRTKCSALITNVLSPYFTKNLLEDIGSAQFSLIIDESTDIATNKQLGIL